MRLKYGIDLNKCPLCAQDSLQKFYQNKQRIFLQCNICKLISVPIENHLSPADEKAQYDKHQNNPDDLDYKKFLSRTFDPLLKQISQNSLGLDFGCGPGPTISHMANEHGIKVFNYDLYYFNQPELLERQYDFITMTEVIEHIAGPRLLFTKLDTLLKQGGLLAIMTKRVIDIQAFSSWHYKNDPTHICFYSIKTFEWIALKLEWRLEVIDKDVVFFHKDNH